MIWEHFPTCRHHLGSGMNKSGHGWMITCVVFSDRCNYSSMPSLYEAWISDYIPFVYHGCNIIVHTIDSRFIAMIYIKWFCTQFNKFEGKTSPKLRIHKIHPCLALTGELWLPFMSYRGESDLEISGMHSTLNLTLFQVNVSKSMMTLSNDNIFRVTDPLCGEFTGPGEFPTQRPVTQSFDVFLDLRLN